MNTLEQQLIDKCNALNIMLDIKKESISIEVEAPRVFSSSGNHWEYCTIIQQRNSKQFNFQKERNASIRTMLDAINTISTLNQNEQCAEGDECEDCTK